MRTHDQIGIRDATDADLPSVAAILNREIMESAYVYTDVCVTTDERRTWLANHRAATLPVLVATLPSASDVPVGWGSLSPYRSNSGYRFTVEASIYVDRSAHRRGVGARLLDALIDAACARGLHALVASIDANNAPSIALFERFGFVEAGRLPEVGRKFERWHTQMLFLKSLESPS